MKGRVQGKELRAKLVRISPKHVLNFLYSQDHLPQFVDLPMATLPDGCVVGGVHVTWNPQTIYVIVEHPSFDPVPPGEEIPFFQPDVQWTRFALATEEELAARRNSISDDQ